MTTNTFIGCSVIFTLAMVMSACIIQPSDADCPDKASCDSCMESAGCGWCSAEEYASSYGEGRCLPGTSFGPADEGACRLTHWYYEKQCYDPVCDDSCSFSNDGSCDEPDSCDRGTDCTDCHSAAGTDENEDRCTLATSCDVCLENVACGWCDAGGGYCLSRDSDGPADGDCDSESWFQGSLCPGDIVCNNSCRYAYDGECDEPTYCDYGTDCSDCS